MENSFAVVTGASSGIGLELAKQFGQNGFELLIVSSSDDIFEAQRELEDRGYTVEALKANLATYAGVQNLYQRIARYGKILDALAINAGVGAVGSFTETDLKEEINIINLNIVSTVHLVKRVLPEMKERGRGRILFTSSIASHEAVTGASKAFLTSFAESLRNEMKEFGVTITAGAETKYENDQTEFARQAFEALMNGKHDVFSENILTKIQSYALKMLPDKAKGQFHRKWSEPGPASH